MLVLARKIGQKLILDTKEGVRIEITLVSLAYDKARIGIEAPRDVRVMREELLEDTK